MKKCLVVDDQNGWRKYNSEVLYELYGTDVSVDTADSAAEGYSLIIENNNEPYDVIITDLQMESDYEPKLAGEWLVEQIQLMSGYYKTQIVIISASYKLNRIADNLGVLYIPKSVAMHSISAYEQILSK